MYWTFDRYCGSLRGDDQFYSIRRLHHTNRFVCLDDAAHFVCHHICASYHFDDEKGIFVPVLKLFPTLFMSTALQ